MIILFSLNCRKKHLQIDWKSPRQVESYSSYQHSFYGVQNSTHSGVRVEEEECSGNTFGERHSAVSSSRVESCKEERKKCEKERP